MHQLKIQIGVFGGRGNTSVYLGGWQHGLHSVAFETKTHLEAKSTMWMNGEMIKHFRY